MLWHSVCSLRWCSGHLTRATDTLNTAPSCLSSQQVVPPPPETFAKPEPSSTREGLSAFPPFFWHLFLFCGNLSAHVCFSPGPGGQCQPPKLHACLQTYSHYTSNSQLWLHIRIIWGLLKIINTSNHFGKLLYLLKLDYTYFLWPNNHSYMYPQQNKMHTKNFLGALFISPKQETPQVLLSTDSRVGPQTVAHSYSGRSYSKLQPLYMQLYKVQ